MTTTSEKTANILKSQFILGVANGERSAAYYRDVLGFTLVQRPSGSGDGVCGRARACCDAYVQAIGGTVAADQA